MKPGRRSAFVFTAAAAAAFSLFARAGAAATVPWTNAGGGNFSDVNNWNSGAGPVPASGDTAQFNIANTYTTTFDGSVTNSGLSIGGSGVTFTTDGTARTYTVAGGTSVTSGALALDSSAAVMTLASGAVNVYSGAGLAINNGNHVTSGSGLLIGFTNAATGQIGSLSVDGSGSSLTVSSGLTQLGNNGGVGNLSFTNGATASLRDLFTYGGSNHFSGANMTVASGAHVTISGYLGWGSGGSNANQTFALNITGAGSSLTQSNGFPGFGSSTGTTTVNVSNGGTFTMASPTVNADATIDFTGGTIATSNSIFVNGGTIKSASASGTFNWADTSGRTMTIQSGGKVDFGGAFTISEQTGSSESVSINLSNAGSRFSTGGLLTVDGGQAHVTASAGTTLAPASMSIVGLFGIGGTVTVDGAGATLTCGNATVGNATSFLTGQLYVKNSATATFSGTLTVTAGNQGIVSVESGANVSAANIVIGGNNYVSNFTVTGSGSTLTQTGASTLNINSAAQLNVFSGAVFTTGTGTTTFNGGTINGNGGTLNIMGDISMTGGSLSQFKWASGRTLTGTSNANIQNGDMLGLSGNTITMTNGAFIHARDIALNGGSTVTLNNGGLIVRSFSIGADGSAASVTASVASGAFVTTTGGFTSTVGAASGSTASATLTNGGGMSLWPGSTLLIKPTGVVNINGGSARTDTLTIDGGRVNFTAGSLNVGAALSITNGGKLDLTNNLMVVRGGAEGTWNGASYDGVSGMIASGRNGGTWDGGGIVTSMTDAIAPNSLTSIGVATADAAGRADGTFGVHSVSSGDVLVMYTYAGDANLDGAITGDDYFQIDAAFAGGSGWFNGDFNYDGVVNGDDYFLIDSNFAAQGAPFSTSSGFAAATAVPEPASVNLSVLVILASFSRRRRLR